MTSVLHDPIFDVPEVPIDYNNRKENTDSIHDEGEEEILGYEGEHEGGGREDLADEEEEHNK